MVFNFSSRVVIDAVVIRRPQSRGGLLPMSRCSNRAMPQSISGASGGVHLAYKGNRFGVADSWRLTSGIGRQFSACLPIGLPLQRCALRRPRLFSKLRVERVAKFFETIANHAKFPASQRLGNSPYFTSVGHDTFKVGRRFYAVRFFLHKMFLF